MLIQWSDEAKTKIDTARKERRFWKFMNGFDGFSFNVEWIFRIYLYPSQLAAYFSSYVIDKNNTENEDENLKKLILRKKDLESVGFINVAIQKREEGIENFLKQNKLYFTKEEIDNEFKSFTKSNRISISETYNKVTSLYFSLLPNMEDLKEKEEKLFDDLQSKGIISQENYKKAKEGLCTGLDLWHAVVKLEKEADYLEWKSDDERVDLSILYDVKISEMQISDFIKDLLCKKNLGVSNTLQKEIDEWQKLHTLRWCLADYLAGWNKTNKIERFLWRMVS